MLGKTPILSRINLDKGLLIDATRLKFVDSRLRGNDRADRSVMAVVIDKGLSFGYEERADCGAFTR